MLSENVIWVDFRAKRYDRREKLLTWRDLVERRARAFTENDEQDHHVVTPWRTSPFGIKER